MNHIIFEYSNLKIDNNKFTAERYTASGNKIKADNLTR